MTLRSGHGNGAGVPRVEVLPPDELPIGVHAKVHGASTSERTNGGKWTKGARTDQSKGGRSRAGMTRLARRLGLAAVERDPAFEPYRRAAADFRRTHVTHLARTVGGGSCGPAPASIVATAAWQLAASRFLFDTARGDTDKLTAASRLGNDSRQNLLAAHELCAKEAVARRDNEGDDLSRERREFQRRLAAKNGGTT
jgi:hypothetical protein